MLDVAVEGIDSNAGVVIAGDEKISERMRNRGGILAGEAEDDRRRIYAAWGSRCKGNQKLAEQGLKRVDFLGDMFMFQGLKKVGDSWEMKLKSGQNSY